MNEEEIKTSHFKTMEELLEHLKMWEKDDDYEAYCRFFDYECAYEMAHKIDKLQKESDKKNKVINLIVESWKQDDVRSIEEIKEYFYKKVEEGNE